MAPYLQTSAALTVVPFTEHATRSQLKPRKGTSLRAARPPHHSACIRSRRRAKLVISAIGQSDRYNSSSSSSNTEAGSTSDSAGPAEAAPDANSTSTNPTPPHSTSAGGRGAEAGDLQRSEQVAALKRDVLALAAAYDRGYGATPAARDQMDNYIARLCACMSVDDVRGGFPGQQPSSNPPLRGAWQMIWTTAFDVLSIANPLSTVSAIYQDIEPSVNSAVNIIDLIPRTQAFLPPNIPTPITRLKVQTRAMPRGPTRVGLLFESVEIEPIKNIADLPFPIKFDFLGSKEVEEVLANLDTSGNGGPGYFDVKYVDEDMLVIQQNAPGGFFVSVKASSSEL